jgi:NAD(P)-dependent dehydrogenase (short-subunit alcohol dehydrogenase family)
MSKILEKLFRLDDRVVVVNGGAGRIGSKMCLALGDVGASVAVLDLDAERAESVADQVRTEVGGKALAIGTDSTDPESLNNALDQIISEFGLPYGLVNATQYRGSGFYGSDPVDHPLDAWNQVFNVNVTGVLLACQTFGKAMMEHGGGSIVNLSSTYGVVSADPRIYGDSGVNSPISYAGSKSAILNMSRYLAVHWREKNIRVNTLIPGGVFDNQGDEFVKNYSARTPLGRMANADEYQGAALFMLSDASSYMTGATVTVDGGWTAW